MATQYNNRIEITRFDSWSRDCSIYGISDASGYIPSLIVKKHINDTNIILKVIGVINSSTHALFIGNRVIDSSMVAGDYVYNTVLDNSIYRYTIIDDKFVVKSSINASVN